VVLRAGTSGYAYDFWKEGFYPPDINAPDMLGHYAARLPAVEINNTFYRIPKAETVQHWREAVPGNFRFAIKASRRITHHNRLADCEDTLRYMYSVLEPLQDTLGAVLFQLPPFLRLDVDRLRRFLDLLPPDARAVIEFRHDSWFTDAVYEELRGRGVAMCVGDYEGKPSRSIEGGRTPWVATSDAGYLRLRDESYDDAALTQWQARIKATWPTAFVFFKHEATAPQHAARLNAMVNG
jgi:uncharacterized protein YecE (DUF72 family)